MPAANQPPVLGIDFGHTTVSVMVGDPEGGKPVELRFNDGSNGSFPAVIARMTTGEFVIGRRAKQLRAHGLASQTIANVLGSLGTDARFLGGELSVVTAAVLLLRHVKDAAGKQLGREVRDVVLSVPGQLTAPQREALMQAAKIAGLWVLSVIPKSMAVGLARMNHDPVHATEYWLVCRIGGESFDVSLLQAGEGRLSVLATTGGLVGGSATDNRLAEEIERITGQRSHDERSWLVLRAQAEELKIRLNHDNRANGVLLLQSGSGPVEVELTRPQLDEAYRELLDRVHLGIDEVLHRSQLSPRDVSCVLPVGGTCRDPGIRESILGRFSESRAHSKLDPTKAAVTGAALAARMADEGEAGKIQRDVVAEYSVGIELAPDRVQWVINAGQRLPLTVRAGRFRIPAQSEQIQIRVCQSHPDSVEGSLSIGEFHLRLAEDTRSSSGEIEIYFSMDQEHRLTVDARSEAAGRPVQLQRVGAGRTRPLQRVRSASNDTTTPQMDPRCLPADDNSPVDSRPPATLPTPPPPPPTKVDQVQFTVYRPKVARPGVWHPLLAFVHLAERRPEAPVSEPDPVERVEEEARQVLGPKAAAYRHTSADARVGIPAEEEITLVPEMPGVEFNPSRRTFRWSEDVHREEFRMRPGPELAGRNATGHIVAYRGALILAQVDMTIRIDANAAEPPPKEAQEPVTGRVFRKIFASYSHKDTDIVRQYEAHVESLGDQYLRDVRNLRAGEDWNEALLRLIREADVFQLFWSANSMASKYVRMEWEYALSLSRPNFVRPTYWETPLPEDPAHGLPPETLRKLHFHQIGPDAQVRHSAAKTETSETVRADAEAREIESLAAALKIVATQARSDRLPPPEVERLIEQLARIVGRLQQARQDPSGDDKRWRALETDAEFCWRILQDRRPQHVAGARSDGLKESRPSRWDERRSSDLSAERELVRQLNDEHGRIMARAHGGVSSLGQASELKQALSALREHVHEVRRRTTDSESRSALDSLDQTLARNAADLAQAMTALEARAVADAHAKAFNDRLQLLQRHPVKSMAELAKVREDFQAILRNAEEKLIRMSDPRARELLETIRQPHKELERQLRVAGIPAPTREASPPPRPSAAPSSPDRWLSPPPQTAAQSPLNNPTVARWSFLVMLLTVIAVLMLSPVGSKLMSILRSPDSPSSHKQ